MSNWVSFDDKWPEFEVDVLMINQYGTSRVGYIIDCGEYVRLKFGSESRALDGWSVGVTHWMTLPDSPEETK